MHFDRAHLLGNVLARALNQPFAEVGGELRSRVGGDVDAAAERRPHVGRHLFGRTYLHRVGNEDTLLSVAVENDQLDGDDRPLILQRGDVDAEPFALHPCRPHDDRGGH